MQLKNSLLLLIGLPPTGFFTEPNFPSSSKRVSDWTSESLSTKETNILTVCVSEIQGNKRKYHHQNQ